VVHGSYFLVDRKALLNHVVDVAGTRAEEHPPAARTVLEETGFHTDHDYVLIVEVNRLD